MWADVLFMAVLHTECSGSNRYKCFVLYPFVLILHLILPLYDIVKLVIYGAYLNVCSSDGSLRDLHQQIWKTRISPAEDQEFKTVPWIQAGKVLASFSSSDWRYSEFSAYITNDNVMQYIIPVQQHLSLYNV